MTARRRAAGPLILGITIVLALGVVGTPAGASSSEGLQALIDGAEAGDVIEVGPGTHRGAVVIDKPLTLRGTGWPVIDAGGKGHVVTVSASEVTIEGFVIRGSGTSVTNADAGVYASSAPGLKVNENRFEDVLFGVSADEVDDAEIRGNRIVGKVLPPSRRGDSVRLWESERVMIEGNDIRGGRDIALWYTTDSSLVRNEVVGARYGVHSMYSEGVLLEENVIRDNAVGAFLMYGSDLEVKQNVFSGNYGPSGYGLGLKDVDGVDIVGNRFVANRVGLFNDNSPGKPGVTHFVAENLFAYNETGVLLMPNVQRNVFHDNAFIDNTEQVGLSGLGKLKDDEWSHEGRGNYWSDYAGYDADRDGRGDREYKVDDLFSSYTDSNPEVAFFTGTPAARAVDMAGRAFPDLRPDPKLVDPDPLVAVPDLPPMIDTEAVSSDRWVVVASALMLLAAGAILAMTRTRRRAEVPAG